MISLEYAITWVFRPICLLLYLACAGVIVRATFIVNWFLGIAAAYLAVVILVSLWAQLRQLLQALKPSVPDADHRQTG